MNEMKRYFKKDWCGTLAYLIFIPISCWVSVKFALSIQPIIDSILSADKGVFQKAAVTCAFWGVLDICLMLCTEFICFRLLKNISIALKKDLCGAILGMSYQDYAKKNNDYVSILNNDTKMVTSGYFLSWFSLYRIIWSFLFSFVTAVHLSFIITLIVVFVGVISVVIPRLLGDKIDNLQLTLSKQKESYCKTVADILGGFSTIKTMQSEVFFEKKHNGITEKTENLAYQVNRNMYFATWFSMLCSSAVYILTLIVGGMLALNGKMTAGFVVSISQLIGGIVAPLEQVPQLLTQARSVKSVCEKCEEILSVKLPCKLQKSKGQTLVCKDVMFHYNNTQNGIEQFTYEFEMGKKYLLVGHSGGGKSTIAQLIAGVYQCSQGSIQYPCDVTAQQDIIYVTQQAHIFCDTLRNNITLGQEYPEDRIQAVLQQCCLTEFVSKLPHGLDEVLQQSHSCSGGEAARIHLARAILKEPKILILDEITANLDYSTSKQIEEMLLSLQNILLITVTHKITEEIATYYQDILYIKNGKLTESGTVNCLLNKKGEFYHLLYGDAVSSVQA